MFCEPGLGQLNVRDSVGAVRAASPVRGDSSNTPPSSQYPLALSIQIGLSLSLRYDNQQNSFNQIYDFVGSQETLY